MNGEKLTFSFALIHLAHLSGSFEGRVFDEREVTFILGETDTDEVILGIQEALIYFGKKEVSR